MKSTYKFEAAQEGQASPLCFTLKCNARQARSVFEKMAFAMAADGGWRSLQLTLQLKSGECAGKVNEATFHGGRA